FETLRTPRGQAECVRLLGMIGLDIDDLEMARANADAAVQLYTSMADPWGVVEAKLLLCQVYLARNAPEKARAILRDVQRSGVKEPEPKQHALLTEAWLSHLSGDLESAHAALEAASAVFSDQARAGDHTPHLLGRLARFGWQPNTRALLDRWRSVVND